MNTESVVDAYTTDRADGPNWTMHLGDSCEVLTTMADNSVDLSVYSPPFASLYTYSPSPRDLGNSANSEEFFEHYDFILREMLRITKPGRNSAVHVSDIALRKSVYGYMGLYDFPGDVIRAHQAAGWIYYGRVTVNKNPQALRHGQRVLTPTGWTPIESLAVGDTVVGSDGCPTKVEGVWPQGVGETFRVTFSDGATVDCDAAHLWTVRNAADRRNDRWQTVRTADLIAGGVLSRSAATRYEVPLVAPVQFALAPPLPLHPYVVGAILGDGNVTQRASAGLTTQRAVAARVASLLPAGHTMREQDGTSKGDDTATFHIGHPDWHRNDVLNALRALGIQGQRAWEKRIPAEYLTASIEDRRELLTGLLDTDGSIKKSGSVWYGTTSEGLARDVIELVQSLGGIAKLRCETVRSYTHNGEARNGRPAWLVCIELDGEPLVTLPHKIERWRTTRRRWTRRIASIEFAGVDERTCITVSADDGLFVTEGFAVTHNSQAIRTKSHALMFVTKNRDSAASRPALADYLLLFKKPGDNDVAVKTDVSNEEWIEWAHPSWPGLTQRESNEKIAEMMGLSVDSEWMTHTVGDDLFMAPGPTWYGIKETETLNERVARDEADERHICPLQKEFIERCVRLWSNKGETVLSPFAGIGSEPFMAVKNGRKGVGVELKPSYWRTAVDNLRKLEVSDDSIPGLF